MSLTRHDLARLRIEKHLDHVSKRNPSEIEVTEEHTGSETLRVRSVSVDAMLRIGQVAVPILNCPIFRRLGSRANAAFAETHFYGYPRQIWLPSHYYGLPEIAPVATTSSNSLSEAWASLREKIPNPSHYLDETKSSLELANEAEGIAEDMGAAALRSTGGAVILFPTK